MKIASFFLAVTLLLAGLPSAAMAADEPSTGLKEGASSLLIPGWGQYQNGEFRTGTGRIKSGVMIAVEIAAIITTSVVGGVAGYPAVWVGIGLFIANHIWSGLDAFINAGKEPGVSLRGASAQEKVNPI